MLCHTGGKQEPQKTCRTVAWGGSLCRDTWNLEASTSPQMSLFAATKMTASRQSFGGSVPRHDRVTGRHRATQRRGQQRVTSVRNHPAALWQSPSRLPAITTTTHQHEPGAIGCKAHGSPVPRDQPSHPHLDAVIPHAKDGCGSVLADRCFDYERAASSKATHSRTQTESWCIQTMPADTTNANCLPPIIVGPPCVWCVTTAPGWQCHSM